MRFAISVAIIIVINVNLWTLIDKASFVLGQLVTTAAALIALHTLFSSTLLKIKNFTLYVWFLTKVCISLGVLMKTDHNVRLWRAVHHGIPTVCSWLSGSSAFWSDSTFKCVHHKTPSKSQINTSIWFKINSFNQLQESYLIVISNSRTWLFLPIHK